MKALKFKSGTWHHRLASVYGPLSKWEDNTDLCTYTRSVIGGLCVAIFITILGVIVAGALSDTIIWGIVMLQTGQYFSPGKAAEFFLLLTSSLAIIAAVLGCIFLNAKRAKAARIKMAKAGINPDAIEPNPVIKMFKSFKDKTCFKVTVT